VMRLSICGSLLFLSLAAGASSTQCDDSRAVFAVIARAPAKARDQKNPYEGRPEAIAAGGKLFRQHCAECHGDDAHGRGRAPDLHSATVEEATPCELAWFLRGRKSQTWPSSSGLPEQHRW
jgi:mono/diheme cytochrome c family protein